jgi:hypothetical protein
MATRLKKVKVNEVSLVTRPAINRQFLLYKSEDGMEEETMVEEIVTKTEETTTETPLVTEPVVEVAKEEPVVEAVVETPVVEKAKEPVKCSECGEPMGDEEGDAHEECVEKKKVKKDMEDISKALEAERIEKAALMAEVAELRKAAELEKQVKITKEYIQKAAVDMKHIPTVVADKFGPVLKACAEKLTADEFNAVYGVLKAADAFIAQNSTLTKELGVGGEDLSADPAAQLDAIAKSYVEKDINLTYAKAYMRACENNPAVYAQHVKSTRR